MPRQMGIYRLVEPKRPLFAMIGVTKAIQFGSIARTEASGEHKGPEFPHSPGKHQRINIRWSPDLSFRRLSRYISAGCVEDEVPSHFTQAHDLCTSALDQPIYSVRFSV